MKRPLSWNAICPVAAAAGNPRERFAAAVERSVRKAFTPGTVTPQRSKIICARCISRSRLGYRLRRGAEAPWEHFSPPTALTCARQRPRSFVALRLQRKPATLRILFFLSCTVWPWQRSRAFAVPLLPWTQFVKDLASRCSCPAHIDSVRGPALRRAAEDETGDGGLRTQHHPPVHLSTRIGNATSPSLACFAGPLSIT